MPVCFTRPALFSVTVCLKRKKKKAHVVHIDYTIIIIHNSLFEIVLPEFTQNIVQILLLETLLLSTVVNGNKTIVYCSTDHAILILAVLLFCVDLQATGREISNDNGISLVFVCFFPLPPPPRPFFGGGVGGDGGGLRRGGGSC